MRKLTVLVLLAATVTFSWDVDISYSFSYRNDSMVKDFGLGIGETGYLSIYFSGDLKGGGGGYGYTESYSGANDNVLTFTVFGPTGFKFKLIEDPGVRSTNSRIHVGTTADTAKAVATEIIAGKIEKCIIGAAAALVGTAIPNPVSAALAAKTAYSIYSKLESGVEYDLITIVVYPARAGEYRFRIDNPTFHPWSKNTLLMTKEPND
ncbi:MAG TPA: hypothetical protein VM054_10080 [bacterium]|nr:hypothetical protein [bacterium]